MEKQKGSGHDMSNSPLDLNITGMTVKPDITSYSSSQGIVVVNGWLVKQRKSLFHPLFFVKYHLQVFKRGNDE